MITERIGIVGGNGWLGNAIAHAAVSRGVIDPARLTLSGRSENRGRIAIPGAFHTRGNAELAARSDVIVLSVRPDQFAGLGIDARGKLAVSVMAGVAARVITERTGADRVVRAMPNAAAAIGRSFTPWHASEGVTEVEKRLVQALFDACGEGAEVPLEAHVDYCAGMTGSGAAFPALLAEALAAHAVAQGLPEDFARRAAKGTVAGASGLFAGEEADTAAIVREMIEYRRTTAAALEAMRAAGFDRAVAAGLEAAFAKSKAMG